MCGPIAMLINGKTKNQYVVNRLAYHTGRTFTYITMGVMVGLLGKIFRVGGIQSILSLAGGVIIIVMLVMPHSTFKLFPSVSIFINKLKHALSKQLRSQKMYATMLTGVLNGFLPCGLVYSALALALIQNTIQESGVVMAAFGLGTVPALLAFTYSAGFIKKILPFPVIKLQRVALLVVALVMIWRGILFSWPQVLPGDTTTCQSPVTSNL
jgi:sulfite exporter TauE/SafE